MAQKNFKVGEAVEVIYQAQNAASGITINMEVYNESHTIVAGGPTVMTELGSSGRYYGTFIPDAAGEWSVQIEKSDHTGQVTKSFSVGGSNIHDIGAKVITIRDSVGILGTNVGIVEGKVDTLGTKIDELGSPPMIG